jgi:hypothetical protein
MKRIHLDLSLREVLEGRYSFRKIVLYSPMLTLLKDNEGRWNISDPLMHSFSGKGTANYQVEEIRIDSGLFDLNGDARFRMEQISLLLRNLSSDPGTRTEMEGSTAYGGNRVSLTGWVSLNEKPQKILLAISSKDFALKAFRKSIEPYRIDTGKIRMDMEFRGEGDIEKGFHITSMVRVKQPEFALLPKDLKEILFRVDMAFHLHDSSLILNTATLEASGITATLTGELTDLKGDPSYRGEINIERMDLSLLNFLKDLRISGKLMSDNIRVKGTLKAKFPEVSGTLRLREGRLESPHGVMEKIETNLTFSHKKETSASGEATVRLLKAGAYQFDKPVDAKLSIDMEGTPDRMAMKSSVDLSPLQVKIKDRDTLSLGQSAVTVDGTIEGGTLSGKASVRMKQAQYSNHTIPELRSNMRIEYGKEETLLKDLVIETQDWKSSAARIRITAPGKDAGYTLDMKGLDVHLPGKEARLKQCDLNLALRPEGRSISGDIRFSAGEIAFQGILSANVSGVGRFDDRNFSMEISRAQVFGGRLKLLAHGRTSDGPFPVKSSFAAEDADLAAISKAVPKMAKLPYRIEGGLKRAAFDGIAHSQDSLTGHVSLETGKVSLLRANDGRNIVKNGRFRAEMDLAGKDLMFKAEAAAGPVSTRLSGTVKGYLADDRQLEVRTSLSDVKAADLREAFWETFPDSLLYMKLDGSLSSDVSVNYGRDGWKASGKLTLNNLHVEGENGEYRLGPVNGTLPVAYGKIEERGQTLNLPFFEKSQFANLVRHYERGPAAKDLYKVTIGSVAYGFPLLEEIDLWVKQDGPALKIERFSANIFGGKLDGSALIELSEGVRYRGGFLIKGLSLKRLCDSIEPIKGFISGKVDGVAELKGAGAGLAPLIGMADFWTYRTEDEQTIVSKEFLQKVGGPALKTYVGNRRFNKGIVGVYLQKGDLIFKELEISNKNFLGITDLSVKVAPLSNRIGLDHLLWTIVEAAERAKKKGE